jgi:hypothetical protein
LLQTEQFKPFFGFGWIETTRKKETRQSRLLFKPFFGFGWIETSDKLSVSFRHPHDLNPSSASAGLKRQKAVSIKSRKMI